MMNKYEEALKRIKSVQAWDEGLGDFWNIFDHRDDDIKLIEELIAEKTEQLSRRDKLVVGSEWECVIPCTLQNNRPHNCYPDCWSHYFYTNDVVEIKEIKENEIIVKLLNEKYYSVETWEDNNQHFLLCFKSREKPNE